MEGEGMKEKGRKEEREEMEGRREARKEGRKEGGKTWLSPCSTSPSKAMVTTGREGKDDREGRKRREENKGRTSSREGWKGENEGRQEGKRVYICVHIYMYIFICSGMNLYI